MNRGKKIIGGTASLVDLKAELLRKKASLSTKSKVEESDDYERAKRENKDASTSKWNQRAQQLDATIKAKIASKNAREKPESIKPLEVSANDELEKQLIASREKLEQKSRLYEQKKIQAAQSLINGTEENTEDDLVNFEDKVIQERRLGIKIQEENDEMVEYKDTYGRMRTCRRSELEEIERENEQIFKQRAITANLNALDRYGKDDQISSDDEEKTDIDYASYQSVTRNEIREHGTAYFQFSEKKDVREEQMQSLGETHEQLQNAIEKTSKAKKAYSQEVRDRLIKLAKRKGFIPEEEEGSSKTFIDKYVEQVDEKKEDVVQKYDDLDVQKNKRQKIRDWDQGKEGIITQFVKAEEDVSDEISDFLNQTFKEAEENKK